MHPTATPNSLTFLTAALLFPHSRPLTPAVWCSLQGVNAFVSLAPELIVFPPHLRLPLKICFFLFFFTIGFLVPLLASVAAKTKRVVCQTRSNHKTGGLDKRSRVKVHCKCELRLSKSEYGVHFLGAAASAVSLGLQANKQRKYHVMTSDTRRRGQGNQTYAALVVAIATRDLGLVSESFTVRM